MNLGAFIKYLAAFASGFLWCFCSSVSESHHVTAQTLFLATVAGLGATGLFHVPPPEKQS